MYVLGYKHHDGPSPPLPTSSYLHVPSSESFMIERFLSILPRLDTPSGIEVVIRRRGGSSAADVDLKGDSSPKDLSWLLMGQNVPRKLGAAFIGRDPLIVVTSSLRSSGRGPSDDDDDDDDGDGDSDDDDYDGLVGRIYTIRELHPNFLAVNRRYDGRQLDDKDLVFMNDMAETIWAGCLPEGSELVLNGSDSDAPGEHELFGFVEDGDFGYILRRLIRKLNDIDRISRPRVLAAVESSSHKAIIFSKLSLQQNRRYKVDMELRCHPKDPQKTVRVFKFGYNFQLRDEAAHIVQINLQHFAYELLLLQLEGDHPFEDYIGYADFAKNMKSLISREVDNCETFKLDVLPQGTDYYTRDGVVTRALHPLRGTRPRGVRRNRTRRADSASLPQ